MKRYLIPLSYKGNKFTLSHLNVRPCHSTRQKKGKIIIRGPVTQPWPVPSSCKHSACASAVPSPVIVSVLHEGGGALVKGKGINR